MNTVLAYPAFEGSFKAHFPQLQLAYSNRKINLELVKNADLVIFSGGEDINPRLHGQKNTYSYFNDERDDVELKVLETSLQENKKVLGVCRGHQLINAVLGGKLVQDLQRDLNVIHLGGHDIFYIEESNLKKIYTNVNSLHHQGVISPGKNLRTTAIYKGVVESTESENIISVQYHPEFMSDGDLFFDYIKEWVNA